MELMQANHQWSTRPADERFTSLPALASFAAFQRSHSKRATLPNRKLTVIPGTTNHRALALTGPNGHPAEFTHWSFQQLSSLAGVPASYLRDSQMPGALAADNLNWGLHHHRDVEEVSVLLFRDVAGGTPTTLRAVNGPNYGTVWNADIAHTLVSEFGDGVTGHWRIPGEFGVAVVPTTDNTTLYASDRDMWCFLADEERRIPVASRRHGESGSVARGFYISNSEVGASRLVLGMFLFDYVCENRIIWGATEFKEIAIRHTSGAPHRWIEEVRPILRTYANAAPGGVEQTIKAAQAAKLTGDVDTFLANRFGKGMASQIQAIHMTEEQRPIETVWDAVTGATAFARLIPQQDNRVLVERKAGDLLRTLAAA